MSRLVPGRIAIVAAGLLLSPLLAARAAVAQAPPLAAPPPPPFAVARRPPSQFFLLEASLGLSLADRGDALGFDAGLTVGVGGKLRHFPPRFFLLGSFGGGVARTRGDHNSTPFALATNHLDLLGGLRILIPIFGPVRIYGDVLGGMTRVGGTLDRYGAMSLAAESFEPMLTLAAGLSLRVHTNLSLGLRARFDLVRGEDPLAAAAGLPSGMGRTLLQLTGTMHF
jgi:hypothetical protein